MARLSKEQILRKDDIRTEEVSVPEWGGEVLIKSLDGEGHEEYQRFVMENAQKEGGIEIKLPDGRTTRVNPDGLVFKVCALHIVDDNGQRVFTEDELRHKSHKALNRIFKAAQILSGLDENADKEIREGLKKAQG